MTLDIGDAHLDTPAAPLAQLASEANGTQGKTNTAAGDLAALATKIAETF